MSCHVIYLEGRRKTKRKPQSCQPISGPKFEIGTFLVRNRSAKNGIATSAMDVSERAQQP